MQVKDVMIHEVTTVRPEDPLRDAAQKMKALAVDPLPVWNGCELVGMLTRERITQEAARVGLAAGMKPVRDAMIPEVVAAFEDEDIGDAVERLAGEKGRELPGLIVLNRSRHLVGIVARSDLERRSAPAMNENR